MTNAIARRLIEAARFPVATPAVQATLDALADALVTEGGDAEFVAAHTKAQMRAAAKFLERDYQARSAAGRAGGKGSRSANSQWSLRRLNLLNIFLDRPRRRVESVEQLTESVFPACPWFGAKTTAYGGLPGGGDISPHTEYLVGASRIFEAAHCILGSLIKIAGRPERILGERAHIDEEMRIIGPKGLEDYGRAGVAPYALDPAFTQYPLDTLQRAVDEIRDKAPVLRKRAVTWRSKIKKNLGAAQPEIYKAARAVYDFVIILAGALLTSVKDWPDRFESAYNDPIVWGAYRELEQAIERMYDAGTKIRREDTNLLVTRRIIEQIK